MGFRSSVYRLTIGVHYREKDTYHNPYHISYLSYTTKTVTLSLQIAREFGLEINIGLVPCGI